MPNQIKHIVFLFIGLLYISNLSAQTNTPIITGTYSGNLLSEFIEKVEQQHNLEFFFDATILEGKTISEKFEAIPLESCLERVCKPLFLNYYIIGNQIYLYGGNPIRSQFSSVEQKEKPVQKVVVQESENLEELRREEYKIINIGVPGQSNSKYIKLLGSVKSFSGKTPLANCNVLVAGTTTGVSTDREGQFELILEKGNHTLQFSSVGMEPTQRILNVYSDGKLDVQLETKVTLLGDIDIYGDKTDKVSEVRSGVERISEEMMSSIPALLGEPDIMKTTLMIPGVQTVGESAQGFNVRGGKTDQNLILVDGAPLYYPSHFFGNFSAVNSDMVKEAILYKGSMPAKYGGRISSVYEINTKDGRTQKIGGSGGISPISAKIALDGPIHNLSTFSISARSTYSDYVLGLVDIPDLYNSEVSFNDIHAKLKLQLSDKDQLKLGFYTSNDKYSLQSDSLYKYKNALFTANYHHLYNDKWSSEVLLSNSMFGYNISNVSSEEKEFTMTHDVLNAGFKNVNEYKINPRSNVNFGAEVNWFSINPGQTTAPPGSSITPFDSENEKALEMGVFAGAEFPVTSRLLVEAGVRLSGFLAFDDGYRYVYADGKPLEVENIVDTIIGNEGQVKEQFFNPEFRFSLNYSLRSSTSLKLSYNRTAQYIHILTNSTAISPTDTWKLSDEYILPQLGHQVSLGLFKNYEAHGLEASVEGFFKRIDNLKEYKPGADLLLNDHIETEILNGKGKSYGIELALKKQSGRFNGWLSYAYLRTLIQADSEFESEQVNGGDYFPASYDKPHNLSILANLKASRRIILSTTLNYSTGRPITYPVAKYQLGDQVMLHYSDYNQYRIPDYFRMDFSVTFEGNLKSDKKIDSSLTFAIYNVTARKNAYSVFYRSEGERLAGYKLSVFATAIPTISYNFKF